MTCWDVLRGSRYVCEEKRTNSYVHEIGDGGVQLSWSVISSERFPSPGRHVVRCAHDSELIREGEDSDAACKGLSRSSIGSAAFCGVNLYSGEKKCVSRSRLRIYVLAVIVLES